MNSLSIPLSFLTVAAGVLGSGRLIDVDAQTLAAIRPGQSVWVESIRRRLRWQAQSTATDDSATAGTVVNPTANGVNPGRFVWDGVADRSWLLQATYVVDPAATLGTSNYENDGLTNATAISTLAEFSRRMGWPGKTFVKIALMAVTVLGGTAPATDPLNLDVVLGPSANFTMTGTATVTRTSTLTNVTALNRATPQALEVTDGAFVWTPNLGQLFTDTTGGRAGAVAWVAKNVGAGVGRLSPLCTPPSAEFGVPTLVTPVNGDGYTLSTVSTLTVGFVRVDCANATAVGSTTALFNKMTWVGLASNFGIKGMLVTNSVTVLQLNSVFFQDMSLCGLGTGGINTANCQFTRCTGVGVAILAGLINNQFQFNGTASYNFIDYDVLGQGGLCTLTAGAFVQVGNAGAWDAASSGNGIRAEGRSCIYSRAFLQGGTLLYGTNNTGFGTFIESASDLIYVTKPTLNTLGVGREISLGGVGTLWAGIPAVTAANSAAAVLRA